MKTPIIVGSSILLIFGLGYCVVQVNKEFAQYVADHDCVVTETKTETKVQMINRYDVVQKRMVLQPTVVTKTSRLYECQVEGQYGTRFWR